MQRQWRVSVESKLPFSQSFDREFCGAGDTRHIAVDIDGPLLQSEDCDHAMIYKDGEVSVFRPELWG